MHRLRLKLNTSKQQKAVLDKAFRCIWRIHNVMIRYFQKQINKLWSDKDYINAVKLYHEKKRFCESANDEDLKKSAKAEIAQLETVMNNAILKYHLTDEGLKKFAEVQHKKFSHIVTVHQIQKNADSVYEEIQKVLCGKSQKLEPIELSDLETISQYSTENGVRFYDINLSNGYPDDISPKYETEIEFLGTHIPVKIKKADPYVSASFKDEISYCELTRILFKNGYHYYVVVNFKGKAPIKAKISKKNCLSTLCCIG